MLFQSLLQRGIVPEIAIFMSGVNEHASSCPTYSNNIANMFQIAQKDLGSQQQTPVEAYSRARDRYRETPPEKPGRYWPRWI